MAGDQISEDEDISEDGMELYSNSLTTVCNT